MMPIVIFVVLFIIIVVIVVIVLTIINNSSVLMTVPNFEILAVHYPFRSLPSFDAAPYYL